MENHKSEASEETKKSMLKAALAGALIFGRPDYCRLIADRFWPGPLLPMMFFMAGCAPEVAKRLDCGASRRFRLGTP